MYCTCSRVWADYLLRCEGGEEGMRSLTALGKTNTHVLESGVSTS